MSVDYVYVSSRMLKKSLKLRSKGSEYGAKSSTRLGVVSARSVSSRFWRDTLRFLVWAKSTNKSVSGTSPNS